LIAYLDLIWIPDRRKRTAVAKLATAEPWVVEIPATRRRRTRSSEQTPLGMKVDPDKRTIDHVHSDPLALGHGKSEAQEITLGRRINRRTGRPIAGKRCRLAGDCRRQALHMGVVVRPQVAKLIAHLDPIRIPVCRKRTTVPQPATNPRVVKLPAAYRGNSGSRKQAPLGHRGSGAPPLSDHIHRDLLTFYHGKLETKKITLDFPQTQHGRSIAR
jgi:hypothetical protein